MFGVSALEKKKKKKRKEKKRKKKKRKKRKEKKKKVLVSNPHCLPLLSIQPFRSSSNKMVTTSNSNLMVSILFITV